MGSMQWQLGREMGTIPAFASRTQENQENLGRDGRSQELPDSGFQPAVRQNFYKFLRKDTASPFDWMTNLNQSLRGHGIRSHGKTTSAPPYSCYVPRSTVIPFLPLHSSSLYVHMKADSNSNNLTFNSDECFGLIDAGMDENSEQLQLLSSGIFTILLSVASGQPARSLFSQPIYYGNNKRCADKRIRTCGDIRWLEL